MNIPEIDIEVRMAVGFENISERQSDTQVRDWGSDCIKREKTISTNCEDQLKLKQADGAA